MASTVAPRRLADTQRIPGIRRQPTAAPVDDGPEARSVGSGVAVVYSDGRRIEGTWTRAVATDPFTLTSATGPILLAPGRTWVELVDAQHNLTDG